MIIGKHIDRFMSETYNDVNGIIYIKQIRIKTICFYTDAYR